LAFFSDPFRNLVSVINIDSLQFLFNIELQKDGPDKLNSLGWFEVVGMDSIFTLQANYGTLFNWKGKVLNRFRISSPELDDQHHFFRFHPLCKTNKSILGKEKVILFGNLPKYARSEDDEYYHMPLIGWMNYLTGEVGAYDAFFPEVYRRSGFNYGQNTFPYISVNGDDILVVFPFTSAIYRLAPEGLVRMDEIEREDIIQPMSNQFASDVFRSSLYIFTVEEYDMLLPVDNRNFSYQLYNLSKSSYGDDREFKILIRDDKFRIVGGLNPSRELSPINFERDGILYFRKRENNDANNLQLIALKYIGEVSKE
jgi:hypothetical protein